MKHPADRMFRLCMMLMPLMLAVTVVMYFLCALLDSPMNLVATCVSLAAIAAGLFALVHDRLLRHDLWPVRSVVVDARLLLTGRQRVHHVCGPIRASERLRMSAGSSMLLLTHAAAIAIPSDTEDASLRAVRDALAEIKVDAGAIRHHYPETHTLLRDGLLWRIYRDGPRERACALGMPEQVLPLCALIWEAKAVPLTEAHLAAIRQGCAEDEVPPVCLASADWSEQGLENVCYLGMFRCGWEVRGEAEAELERIRAVGVNVALAGMSPRVLVPLASRLKCATICPDHHPLILTSVPTGAPGELQVSHGESPARALERLLTLQRFVRRRPLYLALELGLLGGYFLLTELPVLWLVALYLVLLWYPILNFRYDMRLPARSMRRELVSLAAGCGAVLLGGWGCVSFLRSCVGVVPGAELMFLLPAVSVLASHQTWEQGNHGMALQILILIVGVGLLWSLLWSGAQVLPLLFMLAGGLLFAVPLGALCRSMIW